ncbi:MAG: DUF202 domain-containing protein [Crocinitomicaceae bacterium]
MVKKKLEKISGVQRLKSTYKNQEKIILRDFLAMERTTLANERTLFAYLRAGLYLIIAGFAFLKLKDFSEIKWLSYTMFGFSAVLIIYGMNRYIILKRKLKVFYDTMELEYEMTKMDKAEESEQ